jgi:hypothetical protein
MADTPDISSVVIMILENPDLVAKIYAMARGDGAPKEEAEDMTASAPISATPKAELTSERRIHRAKLASAMKPYLSKERAQAIDTMMSIADILEMTRGRG